MQMITEQMKQMFDVIAIWNGNGYTVEYTTIKEAAGNYPDAMILKEKVKNIDPKARVLVMESING